MLRQPWRCRAPMGSLMLRRASGDGRKNASRRLSPASPAQPPTQFGKTFAEFSQRPLDWIRQHEGRARVSFEAPQLCSLAHQDSVDTQEG